MGEVHFDTSRDSFEFSVRDSFSIPKESNDLSNGVIEDFQNEFNNEKNSNSKTIADLPIKDSLLMVDEQINTTESDEIKKSSVEILNPIPRESNDAKECEISIKGNSMEAKVKSFENVLFEQNEEFSSYDESSSKVENKFDTFKCFSNPLFELDEEIISLEKDAFQNEVISNQEKINDTCETEEDLKFFDDLLNEDPLFPDVFNVENDFQDYKEEIDISCDMIPPGIDTDDDSEGDVPPFEEPLDDVLFPLPKVDILPIEVEPVEVMFNDSHTYGENISQVEREFLSMVDEFLNLSNDDETFDPGGGENDVLLNKGENNDLNGQAFTNPIALDFKMKGLKRQKEAKTIKNRQETGKRQRDKSKSEETARNQKPDQPDTARNEVKGQDKIKRTKSNKFSKFEGLLGVIKIKGT
ncbi:hypothetical protein Tco_0878557 [Tanacetum coccineum]|uniref:Uncharacterized protein n=1 Tax=Tanacetum coccineum TaxID=301880 RepID=A0ABQ5BY90_9ASTR